MRVVQPGENSHYIHGGRENNMKESNEKYVFSPDKKILGFGSNLIVRDEMEEKSAINSKF